MTESHIEFLPKFLPSGDTALTVQFGTEIDRDLSRRIMVLSRLLAEAHIPGLIEITPTYRSMLVHYDPLILTQADLIARLAPLLDTPPPTDAPPPDARPRDAPHSSVPHPSVHWQIPICFDADFAPDLGHVAEAARMTPSEVIDVVQRTAYHIYMLGFAPGQPYMGDLPEALHIPRRENPIPRIEKGALVTATGLTIIYAAANPTGWHVIGRTPVDIFDLRRPQPVLFSPGDRVVLTAICRDEFERIENAVSTGAFDTKRLVLP